MNKYVFEVYEGSQCTDYFTIYAYTRKQANRLASKRICDSERLVLTHWY